MSGILEFFSQDPSEPQSRKSFEQEMRELIEGFQAGLPGYDEPPLGAELDLELSQLIDSIERPPPPMTETSVRRYIRRLDRLLEASFTAPAHETSTP